jgi:hypothetical protein
LPSIHKDIPLFPLQALKSQLIRRFLRREKGKHGKYKNNLNLAQKSSFAEHEKTNVTAAVLYSYVTIINNFKSG